MQINVNGQNYDKWEDVPAEVRQQLAATLPDADKNGVPDVFEGNLSSLPQGAQTFSSTSIMVNGQQVQSASDLPPELQAKLQQALGMIGPMFGGAAVPGTGVPGQPATTLPGVPAMPAMPGTPAVPAVPPTAPGAPLTPAPPLAEGQVMLNGVPTTVGDGQPAKKGLFKRLFGG